MPKKNTEKDTTAVLVHIPDELYDRYTASVEDRCFKRQHYSAKLFCEAITKDLKEYEAELKAKKA